MPGTLIDQKGAARPDEGAAMLMSCKKQRPLEGRGRRPNRITAGLIAVSTACRGPKKWKKSGRSERQRHAIGR